MAIIKLQSLEAIGHKQQASKIKTDNDTANSFIHSTIHLKHSKTWNMCYNWLCKGIAHALLNVFWNRGKNNLADYFTKHHSPAQHHIQQYKYFLKGFTFHSQHYGRGCIHPLWWNYLLSYIPRINLLCERPLHLQCSLSVTIQLTINGQNSILS